MTNDHTHNPEVERAVIAVLLDGRHETAWALVSEAVTTPMMFFEQIHQRVFIACQMLAAEDARIAAQPVCEILAAMRFDSMVRLLREAEGREAKGKLPAREDGLSYEDSALAACGGFNAIGDLATVLAPIASLPRNIKILAEHYRQRQTLAAMTAAVDRLRRPGGVREVTEIIDETVNACLTQTASGGTAFLSTVNALANHDAIQAGTQGAACAVFGIKDLDDALQLRPGSLTTIAADTGCGKTSLLLHGIAATAELKGPGSSIICSQEMSRDDIAQIYIARRLRIARQSVMDGSLTMGQREIASEVEGWLAPLRIGIRDSGNSSVRDVVTWATARKRVQPNLSLVAVDYLGLLRRTNPRQTEYDCYTEASRMLKQLAREINVAVVLLAQMNRESRKRERNRDGTLKRAPEPQSGDLKGSGSIEDDSDTVLFLWRPTDEVGQIEAKTTKVRTGPLTRTPLSWVPHEGQRFTSSRQTGADHSTGQTRWERATQQDLVGAPW